MPELFTGESVAAASAASVAEVSPASDPSTSAADVESAEDTTATGSAPVEEPVTTAATADPTTATKTTAPPEDRWPKILENARTKAAQETEAKYGWAAAIPEPHRATVGAFYQTLETEPTQAIEALIASVAGDPQHAPKLRSLLGRLLGNRVPETTEAARPAQAGTFPEPDFQDEQGHTFYSASRMAEALTALEAKLDAKYSQELQPLKTDLQTRDLRAQQVKANQEADQWAADRYAKVSTWPHFKAHEAEIAKALMANPDLDIGDAYVEIVVPQLSQQEKKAVVTHMHDKARASGIDPARSSSPGPKTLPKNSFDAFKQAAEELWQPA